MNIKRTIDKNRKLILYIIVIIIFALFIIKLLNSYYEEKESIKQIEITENEANKQVIETPENTPDYYNTESDSVEKTIRSFVNYCNKRELDNAYKMLTEDCKKALFPTVDTFEKVYIDVVYKVKRDYELTKWSTDGERKTYLIKLYGDILSTGSIDNVVEEYCTFIKDSNGNYKLNINNYIYRENRNIKKTVSKITVEIGHVDVYEEYEEVEITITNNRTETINLTGNTYRKNIYLKNSSTTYSPLNSEFETEELIMEPGESRTFKVMFNKIYNANNKATNLIFSDIILDYEDYLNSQDKDNYLNRTSIKIKYQK